MKILITGDFCPINRIARLIEIKDYSGIYNEFLPNIRNSDLAITNLECPVTTYTTPCKPSGPSLKGDPSCLDALKFAGFNLVSLANNHILDYGEEGLKDTISFLKRVDINYIGAGNSNNEAREPFIFSKDGFTIGILAITENEWSTTHDNNAGANPVDVINNYCDIRNLKQNVDYIIIVYHGGLEHYRLPSPLRKKLFRFFVEAGADVVIGHHSHCYSGYELYEGGYIFYGLGNFLFDRENTNSKYWNEGLAIELIIDVNKIDFRLIPFLQNLNSPGLKLLNQEENDLFNHDIQKLNETILDDVLLNDEFNKIVAKNRVRYHRYLQPYSNIWLSRLFNYGLLPNIWKGRKRFLLKNLIRCETHREIVLKILK